MLDLWNKNAVIYCIDVESYADANGDGIGDFPGLTGRLDYLAGIGVTCIWLLPFYASPKRDDGYDISDYYSVDPRHGTLGDFVEFSHQAGQRGIRVMVDLVVNHTSDQHPWFRLARRDPRSKYFEYYVWSKKKPKDADEGMVFPGVEQSTWTYDNRARAYYFHRFYDFQPDLNIGNPAVRDEILKIMGFWLELGGDKRQVELAFSLLFSMPGTPTLWYGDEIGMGDDLSLPEREGVRAPMQWSGNENGGFSGEARGHARPEQV